MQDFGKILAGTELWDIFIQDGHLRLSMKNPTWSFNHARGRAQISIELPRDFIEQILKNKRDLRDTEIALQPPEVPSG